MTTHTDDFHEPVVETTPSGFVPTVQVDRPAGHTPGPWFVRDFRASRMADLGWDGPSIDSILIVNKTGAEIVEGAGDNCVVARITFDNRLEPLGESNLSDARLIAAAPELLEALRGLVDVVNRPDAPPLAELFAAVADGQAAISRATGGSR